MQHIPQVLEIKMMIYRSKIRQFLCDPASERGNGMVHYFLRFGPFVNWEIYNNPLFRLFFYFVRNLDRFWIDSFHGFNPLG